jgi:hypothetical protein
MIADFRSQLKQSQPRSRIKSGNIIENNRKQQTSTPRNTFNGIAARVSPPCCVVLRKNIERLMLK